MRYAIITLLLIITGQIKSQSTTQPFDRIFIDGKIEVLLRPDDMYDVDAIESKDDVTYSVKDGRLDISQVGHSVETATITVNYKNLTSIRASSGASVEHEGILDADTLALEADKMSRMNLKVNALILKAYVTDRSELTLQGKINTLRAMCASDSELNAGSLEADDVWIHTMSNAVATVTALNYIEAEAESSSTIKVLGDPETKELDSSMGGEIVADK